MATTLQTLIKRQTCSNDFLLAIACHTENWKVSYYILNKIIALRECKPQPGQRAHKYQCLKIGKTDKSSIKTHLGEREEKRRASVSWLQEWWWLAIEIQREHFRHIFANNLKIRPVRPTNLISSYLSMCGQRVQIWRKFINQFLNYAVHKQTNWRTNDGDYITSTEGGGKY